MIKAKLLAMCVCPAIATPPVVLAVHAPARHAVAHILHRAAVRLDHGTSAAKPATKPAPTTAAAPVATLPCTPSVGGAGGGLPVTGGGLIGGGDDGLAGGGGGTLGGGGGFGGGGGGGGSSGGSGGGGSSNSGSSAGSSGFGGTASGSGSIGGSGGLVGGSGAIVGGNSGLPGTLPGSSDGAPIGGTIGGSGLPLPPGGLSPVMPGSGYPPSSPSPVSGAPEPATWAFLVVGFGLVGGLARRDRSKISTLVSGDGS